MLTHLFHPSNQALANMKADWDDKVFHCIPYKESGTAVIGQTDEIQMQLDDHLMKIQVSFKSGCANTNINKARLGLDG